MYYFWAKHKVEFIAPTFNTTEVILIKGKEDVIEIKANDLDNNKIEHFEIIGVDAKDFTIDETTNVLKFTPEDPNAEMKENYNVSINACDNSGTILDQNSITIKVQTEGNSIN